MPLLCDHPRAGLLRVVMRMKKHELLLCSSGFGIVGATFDEPTSRSKTGGPQNGSASSAEVDADCLVFSCRRTTLKRLTSRAWRIWQIIAAPTTRLAHDKLSQCPDDARLPDQAGCSKSILSITRDAKDFSEARFAFTDSLKSRLNQSSHASLCSGF